MKPTHWGGGVSIGAGGHTVWIEPEHEAVVVTRWLDGAHSAGFVTRAARALEVG